MGAALVAGDWWLWLLEPETRQALSLQTVALRFLLLACRASPARGQCLCSSTIFLNSSTETFFSSMVI